MRVKKFRVFVFDNQKAFDSFVNSGWEFGGQTSAAAKTSPQKGGSMQAGIGFRRRLDVSTNRQGVGPGISAKGTKYFKDDDLNN